jgi:hypothetical protein
MKTPLWLPVATVVALCLGVESCDTYSDLVADSLPSASFISSALSIAETSGEQFVTISLDKAAQADGHIVLKVLSQGNSPISTVPPTIHGMIKIPLSAGRSLANVVLFPLDNNKMDGARKVSLSVLPVEGLYSAGHEDLVLVTVADDESPSRVEFEGREASFVENESAGHQVDLRLSAPAPAAGIVIVQVKTDCKYSVEYFTVPSIVNGKVYLPVGEGQPSVGVKVYPINDAVKRADRQLTFELLDAGGGVRLTGSPASFRLWIVEDDVNTSLLPIAPSAANEE